MEDQDVIWISSNGGPLLLLEQRLLCDWHGFHDSGDPDDYDRACEIEPFFGKISVGNGEALVFANPSPASIRKIDTLTVAIFRVIYALDSQSSELHFSDFLSHRGNVVDECTFDTQSAEMCLFDAAYEGTEATKGDHVFFDLESGLHLATSSIVQPDGDTMLHIVLIQTIRSR